MCRRVYSPENLSKNIWLKLYFLLENKIKSPLPKIKYST